MTDTGGPAFPTPGWQVKRYDKGEEYLETEHAIEGMTLRDYFAAKAMVALMSTPEMLSGLLKNEDAAGAASLVAQASYEQADAMLAERANR
jgi:hypothetical protein